ncbi:hypothetical protein [Massilia sp. erpn]|uniref:hypothetical protein n=1 Tax=Massilia sp. erpn TaxID=2738142 RepID=UPI00210703DE|nr:hypothetical protein [Massilia sp. erpn]UTY59922.1 hypothetical protein HPQ68_23675 [Massilia sp. erpn]
MGLFSSKLSLNALKEAVSETVQKSGVGEKLGNAADSIVQAGERAVRTGAEQATQAYASLTDSLSSYDYSRLGQAEFYQERYAHYKDLSASKVEEYFRSTFEVDKTTMKMVDDIRAGLPIPVATADDIFTQCKREAMRRAIASFGLAGIVHDLDARSEAKYNNLSESYGEFRAKAPHRLNADSNFAALSDERQAAQKLIPSQLENGYDKGAPLDPFETDIDHVIAKKEFYDDLLIRVGTTDDEFYTLINNADNLVFADKSLNRSLQDKNILTYLQERGTPHPSDPNLLLVDIKQNDGSIKTVTVNQKDAEEAYARARDRRGEHRLAAAKEVGMAMAKSGAAMAAQQVVGLIVVETIDVFVDEIRDFAGNCKLVSADGWLQNAKDSTERVQQRLAQRFEERQIWARARELGLEAGVAGALSVIPQILISFITKMPAFILAMIRESTLSVVRCVRLLASKEDIDKLDGIQVILAGTATAIAGVYINHVVSKGIAAVPLLNQFNAQVSAVLTGLLVTAVPLAAIYAFDQNKQKLQFIASKFASPATGTA